MCPGPEHDKANVLLKSTMVVAAAGARVNKKEEGVWEFFRSYTEEPHKSRCVRRRREGGTGQAEGDDLRGATSRQQAVILGICPQYPSPSPHLSTHFFFLSLSNCRRESILKAHPEIRKLFGPCPWTKYKVAAIITVQVRKKGGGEGEEGR